MLKIAIITKVRKYFNIKLSQFGAREQKHLIQEYKKNLRLIPCYKVKTKVVFVKTIHYAQKLL